MGYFSWFRDFNMLNYLGVGWFLNIDACLILMLVYLGFNDVWYVCCDSTIMSKDLKLKKKNLK